MPAGSRQTSSQLDVANSSQQTSGKQQQVSLCMGRGRQPKKKRKKRQQEKFKDYTNSTAVRQLEC